MSKDVVAIARAMDFAARKHAGQRRKGKAAEPYVNHLAEVARLVAEATGGNDPVAVLGALLHDTVEDTATTGAELEQEFGAEVAALVAEVTDDKTLPKAERKQMQVDKAPHKSARAKMIGATPPKLVRWGSTTLITSPAATPASAALPPRSSIRRPAMVAR